MEDVPAATAHDASRAPEPVDENPLLAPAEIREKNQQEILSAFLIGGATVGIAVGGYFLIKWIISKPTVLETALEAQY